MSYAAAQHLPADTGLTRLAALALPYAMALWVFSGAFVFVEPSPYEVLVFPVIGLMLLAGTKLSKRLLPFIWLLGVYLPAALISAFMVRHTPVFDALKYNLITLFVMFTGFVAAMWVAEQPFTRMRRIANAYIAAAVFAAILGTLGYFRLIPGADLLLEFGRAKGTFKDPNVYGPFLILPAAYCFQRLLMGDRWQALLNTALLGILAIGVFVSFSRAAWGHFAVTMLIVFALVYLLEARGRMRARLSAIAIAMAVVSVLAFIALLSVDSVAALFADRAQLIQDYDTGSRGRFGRIGYAIDIILKTPLGTGPLQFRYMVVTEEPHNTYVKFFLDYGWLGGIALLGLVGVAFMRMTKCLAIASPNRLALIPLVATFVPLSAEAAIIDVDHWRHYFLILGLIWGVTAGYDQVRQKDVGQVP